METTATMISAIVAAVALVLTFVQFRKRAKLEHAQQVFKMQESIRNNENATSFFRMIDYGEKKGWYQGFHCDKKLEKMVDDALLLYNYILYLRKKHILNKKEFSYFQYEIDKIVKNKDVQCYFFALNQHCERVGLPFKFDYLLQYGIDKKYIGKDIQDGKSNNYGELQII